ncbi:MAG: DUF488 domain-containing protein [Fervidicoccaceae archaeon]
MSPVVYTVGYSGRTPRELIELLRSNGVERVVDVRRWNYSRRAPEFSGPALAGALALEGIDYVWIPELGGYRRFGVDADDRGVGSCLGAEGFRAYAAYITTRLDVRPALRKLEYLASEKTSALLCRERSPTACHRRILSDYLMVRGFRVIHVVGRGELLELGLSPCARASSGELEYV